MEWIVLALALLIFLGIIGWLINSKSNQKVHWHHRLNSWIILNLSFLNACLFFVIVLTCALFGAFAGSQASTTLAGLSSGSGMSQGFGISGVEGAIGFLVGAIVGCLVGFIYCGLFSILLTLSKDISRIAYSLEKESR